MKRRTWVAAAVGTALTTGMAGAQTSGAVLEWPLIQLLDGGTIAPASWRDLAAVVVFWATHCPYCKRHNAHVDKLYRASRGQPLRILTVAEDSNAGTVRRYMSAHNYSFPVALSDGMLRSRLTARRIIPMTCVIDREGRLRQAIPGEMSEDDVLGLAQAALSRPR